MTRKVAILRGINVGGHRKILMKDLSDMFLKSGFIDVKTYIQSGNIIFTSTNKYSHKQLSLLLEQKIFDTFGFEVPVIIRDAIEIENLIKNNPLFKSQTDINNLHITFLQESPEEELLEIIETTNYSPDLFKIVNSDIYIYCQGKYHQSKLSNHFFEKKLNAKATTRNWKTVIKLAKMASE